jgi:DNA-binding SARP family transcriptional activator
MPFMAKSAALVAPGPGVVLAPPPEPDRPAQHLLSVQLLGRFQVRLDDVAVRDWPSGRGRSLFKYLVTHRDPWPRREQLMDAFWPEAAPAAARNSLNVAVHGLRRAFRSGAEVPVVVLEDGTYRLGGLAFDRHQYGACVTLGRLMVERDPCREDGHRRLMRCFARQGQPHLALRPYLACAEALDRELGVDPDPATVALAQRIRHQPV